MEPIFVMLILSYSVVLLFSILLLKRDSKKSLSKVFKMNNSHTILIGVILALLFQAVWFSISWSVGCNLQVTSLGLKGYESYAIYSTPLALLLYVVDSVFGAFVEEINFRSYIQTRIGSRPRCIPSILLASLLFSLQHIHIFQFNWIERFFQTQFIYVFCFGIYVGYLFVKSKENLWSVFAFHASMNIFNISLPIKVTFAISMVNNISTLLTFIFLILLLRLIT